MDLNWPPLSSSRNSNVVTRQLVDYGPQVGITFSPNDNGRAGTGTDYHTYGMAVDFYAPSGSTNWHERQRDFAKWLYDHYSGYLLELIHTTPFNTDNGFYVKNGGKVQPGFYGAATEQAHVDHVHVAMDMANAKALIAKLNVDAFQVTAPALTGYLKDAAVRAALLDAVAHTDKVLTEGGGTRTLESALLSIFAEVEGARSDAAALSAQLDQVLALLNQPKA